MTTRARASCGLHRPVLGPPVRVDVAGGEEPGDGEGGGPRARGEREQQPAHARRGLALAVLVQTRGVPRHSGQGGNIISISNIPLWRKMKSV